MSTTTRAREVEAFEHILCDVLGLDKNSLLWEALYLNGYNSISDIATLTDAVPVDQGFVRYKYPYDKTGYYLRRYVTGPIQ